MKINTERLLKWIQNEIDLMVDSPAYDRHNYFAAQKLRELRMLIKEGHFKVKEL